MLNYIIQIGAIRLQSELLYKWCIFFTKKVQSLAVKTKSEFITYTFNLKFKAYEEVYFNFVDAVLRAQRVVCSKHERWRGVLFDSTHNVEFR